jgi:y4mF family transcriptional regulator
MDTRQIGQTISKVRKKAALTQQQLAQLAGVGKTVVFDIEKGKETVQLNTLLKILETLNIKLSLKTPFSIEDDEQ